MAEFNFQSQSTHATNFSAILATEGVEFLHSSEQELQVPIESINEKMICLFFSASWCRPCRSFTPHLVQLYNSFQKQQKDLEIIFISFDRNESRYAEHLKTMPWLAVPFNPSLCKKLRGRYKVDRIPLLVPLFLDDSGSVDEDVTGLIEDYGAQAFPFTRKRREELKAMDEVKRLGGKLEKLLTHEDRNYVVSRNGNKVPVSQLVNKTIGLYFGAHWSPPCRSFTSQLTETYNDLSDTSEAGGNFEVVFVSTDRDTLEFTQNLTLMPWLAIPYQDSTTRHDLCRIFNINAIPALVIIGQDGKLLNPDGKSVVSLYGARGFPFTESRIKEIEIGLRKEGEALRRDVIDKKHEHVLKLDLAKAYVCDFCRKQGKFWAFSCHVCDYDLHPTCIEEAS